MQDISFYLEYCVQVVSAGYTLNFSSVGCSYMLFIVKMCYMKSVIANTGAQGHKRQCILNISWGFLGSIQKFQMTRVSISESLDIIKA